MIVLYGIKYNLTKSTLFSAIWRVPTKSDSINALGNKNRAQVDTLVIFRKALKSPREKSRIEKKEEDEREEEEELQLSFREMLGKTHLTFRGKNKTISTFRKTDRKHK